MWYEPQGLLDLNLTKSMPADTKLEESEEFDMSNRRHPSGSNGILDNLMEQDDEEINNKFEFEWVYKKIINY